MFVSIEINLVSFFQPVFLLKHVFMSIEINLVSLSDQESSMSIVMNLELWTRLRGQFAEPLGAG